MGICVCQGISAQEKELSKEALNYKEIVDLLTVAGLMKIVTEIDPCYEKLVREFIVNISPTYNDEGSHELRIMYVRGKHVMFSPSTIDSYLCINKSQGSDTTPSLDKIVHELTVV